MSHRISRRTFLSIIAAVAVAPACAPRPRKHRLGIALGGGGARGIAHIPMLEVLDELQIRPYRIAGTSIGAIMGALYASGLSSAAIRDLIDRLTVSKHEKWSDALFRKDVMRWLSFLDPTLARGGLLDSTDFLKFLRDTIQRDSFEELDIPLKVVAADFWKREQVVFESGELFPAIKASMAIPGLFVPVKHRGHVLVDGSMVNPVPYDLLLKECDVVVAIDVLDTRSAGPDDTPSYLETTFNSFQIMQAAIVREKLQRQAPEVYIRPELENIRVLDFYKADEIYLQARAGQDLLRRRLRRLFHL